MSDWVYEIRHNQREIGNNDFLPSPEGLSPTPATRSDGIEFQLRTFVEKIRKAILSHPEWKTQKVTNRVIAEYVDGNNQLRSAAIKTLRNRGELAK